VRGLLSLLLSLEGEGAVANVSDVDPSYRDIARQVPPQIRREMRAVELSLRCEHVSDLLDAKRTVQAARACQAAPFAVLFRGLHAVSKLAEIAKANNDDDTAQGLARQMRELADDNPSSIPALIAAGDERALEVLMSMTTDQPQRRRWRFFKRSK
jgi:hypothetical protein